jgi:hypothetical protein
VSALSALIAAELAEPVDPRVTAMAAAIAARHPGALGVIFYGSCLRDATLSGMLDFYVIVEDYRRAYGRRWLALANQLLPPNVFPFAADGLAAKYAVLSLDHLRRETSRSARDPSTYARLAQPVRLVWQRSESVAEPMAAALAQAVETLLMFAAPLVPPGAARDPLAIWHTAFANTYRSELRTERNGRSDSIVAASPERYLRLAELIVGLGGPWPEAAVNAARAGQRHVERVGKRRQVARLAKASFTFAGGIDYLAWKINRHAGIAIEIKPWQRRWPLLGAVVLVPKLFAKGAIR